MMQKLIVLLMFVSLALSDTCVTYNFEEDFDVTFINNTGLCLGMQAWIVGRYADVGLVDYDERSTEFIYPNVGLSCITSLTFPMTPGGVIEVNMFMEPVVSSDQIQVLVMEHVAEGTDRLVAMGMNTLALASSFVAGWHTMKLTVTASDTGAIDGYVTILGIAAASSTVLIDSLRYIPPESDQSECELYPDPPSTQSSVTDSVPTDSPQSTDNPQSTDSPQATDSPQSTDNPQSTDSPRSTDSPQSTDNPQSTDSPQSSDSAETTDLPTTLPTTDNEDSFWTPLRIKIAAGVILSILSLITLSICCFCCCRRNPVAVVVVNK